MKFFSYSGKGQDDTEVRVDEDSLTILSPRNLNRPLTFAQAASLRNIFLVHLWKGTLKIEFTKRIPSSIVFRNRGSVKVHKTVLR